MRLVKLPSGWIINADQIIAADWWTPGHPKDSEKPKVLNVVCTGNETYNIPETDDDSHALSKYLEDNAYVAL